MNDLAEFLRVVGIVAVQKHDDVGNVAIGDKHLRPIQHIVVTIANRCRLDSRGI